MSINWDLAVAYCNCLSAKSGKKYRLPTEAKWEKAARGADQRRYAWGDEIDSSYANYINEHRTNTISPVGFYDRSKRGELLTHNNASPYGAYDMAGNVLECARIGMTAINTLSPRGKIQRAPIRAHTGYCAGACSLQRRSICVATPVPRHGLLFSAVAR
jgi:hypothetical protein